MELAGRILSGVLAIVGGVALAAVIALALAFDAALGKVEAHQRRKESRRCWCSSSSSESRS